MSNYLRALIFALLLIPTLSQAQLSDCDTYQISPSSDIEFSQVNISPNAPIGAVLATATVTFRQSCHALSDAEAVWYYAWGSREDLTSNGEYWDLRNGYGLKVSLTGTNAEPIESNPSRISILGSGGVTNFPVWLAKFIIPGDGKRHSIYLSYQLQLIKNGELSIDSFPIGSRVHIGHFSKSVRQASIFLNGIDLTASIRSAQISTCNVTTKSIAVSLPAVRSSDLEGAGSTAGDTMFNIGMQCAAGATVFATFTDATDPGNRTDQLSLATGSTAEGVKLRILRLGGLPVTFGPDSAQAGNEGQWLVGPSEGLTSIPMTTQYIKAGSAPIKAGIVQGRATFTMSYQ